MGRKRIRQSEPQVGESLAEEAAQFLAGSYLDVAFSSGGEVPAWAWLSQLAHGDEATLARTEQWLEQPPTRPEFDAWGRVLQVLAREVRETATTLGCPLVELQRDLLVPLELAVLLTPVGPATMYRMVSSILAEVRTRVTIERS